MLSEMIQYDSTGALPALACAGLLVVVTGRAIQRRRNNKSPQQETPGSASPSRSESSGGSLTTTSFPGACVSIDNMTDVEFRAFEAEVRRQSDDESMDVGAAIRALRPVAARYQDPATCPPFDDIYMARLGLSAGFAPDACDERLAGIQRSHQHAGGVRTTSADLQRWPMLFVPFEDALGRPCVLFKVGTLQAALRKQHSDFGPEVLAEAFSAFLDAQTVHMLKKRDESSSRPCKNPLDQSVLIVEIDGLNLFSGDVTTQHVVTSLNLDVNYPTQVGKTIILSGGPMFTRMFRMSKGLMHESTHRKLDLISIADTQQYMQNLVHPDHREWLMAEYGGPAGPLPEPGTPADFEVLFGTIAGSAWRGLGLKKPVDDSFRIRVSGGPALYGVFVELGSSDKTTFKASRSSSELLLFLEEHEPSEEQSIFACCSTRSHSQGIGAAGLEARLNALIAQGGCRKKAALYFAGLSDASQFEDG